MRNHLRKFTAGVGITLLVVTAWAVAARTQQGKPASVAVRQTANETKGQTLAAESKAIPPDEKIVRDVYARLMRYQSAAVDELTSREGTPGQPDDYVTFEISSVRSGDLTAVLNQPASDLLSPAGEEVLNLSAAHLGEKEGASHAYYEAAWGAAQVKGVVGQVKDLPIGAYDKYVSYVVRLTFQGKRQKYRALTVYSRTDSAPDSRQRAVHIFDNTVLGMNEVYAEESPRVRSPWSKYVKTSLFQAVIRSIKDTRQAGLPLIPPEAPVGYLPGDDAVPNDQDSLTMARLNSCESLSVTMSPAQTIRDGASGAFSVTTSGGTPTAYQWSYTSPSGAGNNPNVNFTGNNSASVTTNGHWFALPDNDCTAVATSTYTIKCNVIFDNTRQKSAQTTLTIDAYWNPAGYTAPPQVTGGVEVGFDFIRQVYVVVGPGTATRGAAPVTIIVPTSSQFFSKTNAHEDYHAFQYLKGINADLFQVSDLMTHLMGLSDRTRQGLNQKIATAFLAWDTAQHNLVNARLPAAEAEAYSISDPMDPMYLYQNCGRYP